MKRNFRIKYWESFLPTRRHRKLHWRECQETVAVEIIELTLAEAPVAIRRTKSRAFTLQVDRDHGLRTRMDYHYHDSKLYSPVRLNRFMSLNGKPDRMANVRDIYWTQPTYYQRKRDEALAVLHDHMDRFKIINGRLCEHVGEPRYVIMTFGLGGNHGLGWGTSISVDHHFNSNILTERYYRIDQEREANAAGLEIALRRGDTKAVPHFKRRLYDRFEILIPEAIRMRREDAGPVNEFTKQIEGITSGGLPPFVAGLALMMAVTK